MICVLTQNPSDGPELPSLDVKSVLIIISLSGASMLQGRLKFASDEYLPSYLLIGKCSPQPRIVQDTGKRLLAWRLWSASQCCDEARHMRRYQSICQKRLHQNQRLSFQAHCQFRDMHMPNHMGNTLVSISAPPHCSAELAF